MIICTWNCVYTVLIYIENAESLLNSFGLYYECLHHALANYHRYWSKRVHIWRRYIIPDFDLWPLHNDKIESLCFTILLWFIRWCDTWNRKTFIAFHFDYLPCTCCNLFNEHNCYCKLHESIFQTQLSCFLRKPFGEDFFRVEYF